MLKALLVSVALISTASAAELDDGAAIFQQHCAVCHQGTAADARTPTLTGLRMMSAQNALLALQSGVMRVQAGALSANQKERVAEFVTGKPLQQGDPGNEAGACTANDAFSVRGASWNGWSADQTNTRFQSKKNAGITAAQVPRLKLKWAFAFSGVSIVNAQASVVGGRIFMGSVNRNVYSLDAKTGCRYWTFHADAGVRAAVKVVDMQIGKTRAVAFFADTQNNVYAVDAASGGLLWKVRADNHPASRVIGSLVYHDGMIFVPITAAEEGQAVNATYQCCTGRGILVAVDARTGAQRWKTYMIDETPQIIGKNRAGTPAWGPSGVSIWSAPTIDAKRNLVYVATGDNFSGNATARSDSIIALDTNSGKIVWTRQVTAGDVFNNSCITADRFNCPSNEGPDHDFASPAMLTTTRGGKPLLLAGQKSGVAYGFDPLQEGKILWQTKVGKGGIVGGIQFGVAADARNFYVAVSDLKFTVADPGRTASTVDPKEGGGLFALNKDTGDVIWSAKPHACDPQRVNCSPAQSAALAVIDGVVFSGAVDGHLRAYSTLDGNVVWDFDTVRDYTTVNGVPGKGGSINGPGPAIVDGMLYTASGYGIPGNVLLAFSVDGK